MFHIKSFNQILRITSCFLIMCSSAVMSMDSNDINYLLRPNQNNDRDHIKRVVNTCESLMEYVDCYLETLEGFNEIISHDPRFHSHISIDDQIKNIKSFNDSLNVVKTLFDDALLESLFKNTTEVLLNKMTKGFMTIRLENLDRRFNQALNPEYIEKLKQNSDFGCVCFATTTNPDRLNELDALSRILADLSIDQYQLLNRIILDLLKLFDYKKLPEEIALLLRMSPKICQRISDPMMANNLGHPDEAIIRSFENEVLDLFVYNNYLSVENNKVKLKAFIKSLPMPDFMNPVPSIVDPESIDAKDDWLDDHEKPKSSKSRKAKPSAKNTKSKSKSKSNKVAKVKDQQPEVVNEDISSHIDDITNMIEDVKISDELTDNIEQEVKISSVSNEVVNVPVNNETSGVKDYPKIVPDSTSQATPINKRKKKEPYQGDPKLYMLGDYEEGYASKSTSSSNKSTTLDTYLDAFLNNLSTKNKELFKKIIGSDYVPNVSYQQFKTLWLSLGGQIVENKGGSHRALKYNGKVVGATFEVHSNHTYGPKCLKYLKKAILNILPSNLSVFIN